MNSLLAFKYTHTPDFQELKQKGVLSSGDYLLHLEKAPLIQRLTTALPFRLFGTAKNLSHDFQLHITEELTKHLISTYPELKNKNTRIRSHIIAILNENFASKIHALENLSDSDISEITQLVINKLDLNLYSKNHEIINKSITELHLSDKEFNQFLSSETIKNLLELATKEEFTKDDINVIYAHYKNADLIASKNLIALQNFVAINHIPPEIKKKLKSIIANFINPDALITSPILQELSNGDITRCYNYLMINNSINAYKFTHPTLFPKHMFKDYFQEEDHRVLERAFHPHIHWRVINGKNVIQHIEVEELKTNGLLIADIERKIEKLRNQDPKTFWSAPS